MRSLSLRQWSNQEFCGQEHMERASNRVNQIGSTVDGPQCGWDGKLTGKDRILLLAQNMTLWKGSVDALLPYEPQA